MEDKINFFQGATDLIAKDESKQDDQLSLIVSRVSELFNMKNIYFLFGSGTSSGAIPIMSELFNKVKEAIAKLGAELEEMFYNIDLGEQDNFEELLAILYAQKIFLENQKKLEAKEGEETKAEEKSPQEKQLKNCKVLISEIEKTIFNEINVDIEANDDVLDVYKRFYQKVSLRNRDLSRICVFTTNNDLFSETALDSINVNYINGFHGGLNKFFNPAFFNYSFSKRMDTSIDKYEPVENMIYLYKLHGSINWVGDRSNKNSFFDISEIVSKDEIVYKTDSNTLIYPTPTKQDKSLGSPYTELFREFQKKLLEQQSVLFIVGYGFNDEHVNNIIHQALATNSSLNVVIFKELKGKVKLGKVDDSRVFKIWGTKAGKKITHFDFVTDNFIPDLNQFRSNSDLLTKFIENIKEQQ